MNHSTVFSKLSERASVPWRLAVLYQQNILASMCRLIFGFLLWLIAETGIWLLFVRFCSSYWGRGSSRVGSQPHSYKQQKSWRGRGVACVAFSGKQWSLRFLLYRREESWPQDDQYGAACGKSAQDKGLVVRFWLNVNKCQQSTKKKVICQLSRTLGGSLKSSDAHLKDLKSQLIVYGGGNIPFEMTNVHK